MSLSGAFYNPGGGGGAFMGLSDVPAAYAGFKGCAPIVNAGETGLVFGPRSFPVSSYGAVGNGRFLADGAISSGSNTLVCGTSAPFTANDIGKTFVISGAGIAGADLTGTITGYTSPSTVTLSIAAAATVSGTRISYGTDDSQAIRAAVNDAFAAGGGTVIVEQKFYFMGPTASLPIMSSLDTPGPYKNIVVVLSGNILGPFNTWGSIVNSVTPPGPTFLITNRNDNFIHLLHSCAVIQDVGFLYPNQVPASSEGPPVAYPYTIKFDYMLHSVKIKRCTFWNSWNGIDATNGAMMCFFQDIFMGAYNKGLVLDQCREVNYIQNYHNQVYWNFLEGNWSGWTPITTWVFNNPDNYCLEIYGAEQQMINNMFSFFRHGGLYLGRSNIPQGGQEKSYGLGTNIHCDLANIAIQADYTKASYAPWRFANIEVIGNRLINLKNGGAIVRGGYAGLSKNVNACTADTGAVLDVSGVHNFNPLGVLTSPAVPASAAVYTNTFVVTCRVYISGGTVSDVKINGASTGMTGGEFTLAPQENISITYTAAPTWKWFGL